MKLVFDVDLEKDNLDDKLLQLRDLENAILVQLREIKMDRLRKEGDRWLKSLPEKYF